MAVKYYKTGNKSHKKGEGLSTKRGRPKGRKIRHFSALDAARCVAYARRDGADDVLLVKYLIYAFGWGNIPCIITQSVLLLSDVIMTVVLTRLIGGFYYIIKGVIKVIKNMDNQEFMGDFFINIMGWLSNSFAEKLKSIPYSEWLIWFGSIQVTISALILFLNDLQGNMIYFRFMNAVCKTKIPAKPFKIIPR